jgi:hypothetical protein
MGFITSVIARKKGMSLLKGQASKLIKSRGNFMLMTRKIASWVKIFSKCRKIIFGAYRYLCSKNRR